MRIASDLYDEIILHALERPHTEVCGLVAAKDGVAKAVYRCVNTDEETGWGSMSFTMDPLQQILLLEAMKLDGYELGAIYHSHPGMNAVPSAIDEDYAEEWPGILWIIVGLRGKLWSKKRRPFDVWTWRIGDGQIRTAELTVE